MKPNNKMTTIYILNWHEYQSKPNNKITTKQQQNNTNQEIRNKEIKKNSFSKKSSMEEKGKRLNDFFARAFNKKPRKSIKSFKSNLEYWLEDLDIEDIEGAIEKLSRLKNDPNLGW